MRLNLLHKLDDLLETCKTCPRIKQFNHSVSPEMKCKGCSTYEQIRGIGENLGRKKQVAQLMMTVDEFINLKHDQKLTVSKIAGLKGVSEATVYNWQKNRQGQINMALGKINIPSEIAVKPTTAEVKPSKCNCIKEDKTAEYERVITGLKHEISALKATCVLNKEEFNKLMIEKEKLENVNFACEDVENEIASLREDKDKLQGEYNKLITKQYHNDYLVENQKKRIEDLGKTLERYELENRAMRELLRQWI